VEGITPAGLQTLLTSKRSCANPRRIFVHVGKPTNLILGPPSEHCEFRIGSAKERCTLAQAEFTLRVVANSDSKNGLRLQLVPEIRHGANRLFPEPAPDRTGFLLQVERPMRSFSELSCETALAPNQYLVLGARLDAPQSLGFQCFFRRDEPAPVQRLLVLRASHTGGAAPGSSLDPAEDDSRAAQPVPLAMQASLTEAAGGGQ
jgi:hypothetical protein